MTDRQWLEFRYWRRGMLHALEGGLWLHRFVLRGVPMAHLVSSDRQALLGVGSRLGLDPARLQYRPLKHPHHGTTVDAWHWDLRGGSLALAVGLAQDKDGARPR